MTFHTLELINEFIWGYVAFILILGMGLYFSFRSRFFQVRRFGAILATFPSFLKEKQGGPGIHPIKVFFAAIGGCIGIGNVVGIVTAVQIGGPGALFWAWIGGLAGMLIQYSEVYLGMKHRVANKQGSYDGGPMYFLPRAFKGNWVAPVICFLLCIYGVEIFMFNVMTESLSTNWHINEYLVVAVLMVGILVVASGGINRVGEVCSALIPLFIILYVFMALWVIFQHSAELPSVFKSIFEGAFTPQAAKGGFLGSTVMLTISMGLSRGAYSGDIGVGYTSVIYAESGTKKIEKQSSMTIIGIFIDTFVICTLSILVVLATGYWHTGTDVSLMVQEALGMHFPYMHLFMPMFLFLLGFTTILAYFVVGAKCAKFISKKWGPILYYLYACVVLPVFAFVDATQAFVIMSLSGACLLILNLTGIFLLRKEIRFGLD
jgi:AGCS family alanine or glycine:cation symporter